MMSGGGGFGGGPSVVVQQPVQAAPAEQEAPAEEVIKLLPVQFLRNVNIFFFL